MAVQKCKNIYARTATIEIPRGRVEITKQHTQKYEMTDFILKQGI